MNNSDIKFFGSSDRFEGQIELLDDLLNKVYQKDMDLAALIEHSRRINNQELLETLRTLIIEHDLSDVKKMLLSL